MSQRTELNRVLTDVRGVVAEVRAHRAERYPHEVVDLLLITIESLVRAIESDQAVRRADVDS